MVRGHLFEVDWLLGVLWCQLLWWLWWLWWLLCDCVGNMLLLLLPFLLFSINWL